MINPHDDEQIERALASLAAEKSSEQMPAEIAARFEAHLEKLISEDSNVVRTHRFGLLNTVMHVGNRSRMVAASILVVMVFIGFQGLGGDDKNRFTVNTSEKPRVEVSPGTAENPQQTAEPTATAGSEQTIPNSSSEVSPGTIFGNGQEVEGDLTQMVRATQSGFNYSGYLGPIAEKIQPLELPGNLTSLSSSHRACIKSLGISGMTIGVDSGSYKGTRITAYWVTTGAYERGAVLVSDGCTFVKFIKE